MAEINTGDMVRISAAFTNLSDVPADPTTITLKIRVDDSTISTFVFGSSAMVKDSVGNYHYDYTVPTTNTTCKVEYRWEGTGAVVAIQEGMFYATSRIG